MVRSSPLESTPVVDGLSQVATPSPVAAGHLALCRTAACLLVLLAFSNAGSSTFAADEPFELQDGDRVVFLGSEFTEQATRDNYAEAALTQRWPERRITFRNLGWAGDDPTAVARGYFGGAEEGYRRLQEELSRLKPTVIFVEYGENSAYAGEAGLPQFRTQMQRLIGDLKKLTPRIVLVSPPPMEKLASPLPDPAATNASRQAYGAALQALATEEHLQYIDIFAPLSEKLTQKDAQPLTTDTLRYNQAGYAAAAEALLSGLQVTGFHADSAPAELRELIRVKNDLYFHQYRPQNETYIRGFRKHEQGQNAKDIAEFEPLITAAEERIAAFVQGKPLPPAAAEPAPKKLDFTALTPQEQQQKFLLAEGLEIAPFAAEPLVANPIHMNFDGRGRLWVATSPIYPQIRPGARPSDEIVILEDTDGDHVADKRTVFANDLLIPTAVLPDEHGGAYVANSTELLHLHDRDGDGVADAREVVLSGFGTEDTHHILHTFRWSPDALLCFNQSIYIHSHLETPYGVQKMMGSGIWRFRDETARANTVAFGTVNPWGHIFDRWGQSFATDGAGGEGIYYIFPGAAYQTAVGFDRLLTGMNPGQPKLCGLEILTGEHFTDDYAGTLVAADFRGNRICRFRLSPESSGYVSRQLDDVLTCQDRAFRPVDLKIAPDGSLFVADWHNPIINHGEVDFRDARRDDRHGRIWRIARKGHATAAAPVFADASIDQLCALLNAPEQWTRHMARVHLRQRDHQQVLDALQRWRSAQQVEGEQLAQVQLEMLWTCQALGAIPQELLVQVLQSPQPQARAAGVRVVSQASREAFGLPAGMEVLPWLSKAVQDEHPQVRLEAVNALRYVSDPQAPELALRALDQPMDAWLDFALWSTIRTLEPQWSPALLAGTAEFAKDPRKLLFVLKVSDQPALLPLLMQLALADTTSAEQLPEVLALVVKVAGPEQARQLLDRAQALPEQRSRLLSTLVDLGEKRQVVPSGDLAVLEELWSDPAAVSLAGLWKVEALRPRLVSLAEDNAAPLALRERAIRSLANLQAKDVLQQLVSRPETPLAVRQRAIGALQTIDAENAAELAAELLVSATPADAAEIAGFLDGFLARKSAPDELAQALQNRQLAEAVATPLIQKAGSLGGRGTKLTEALRTAAGMQAAPKTYTPEEIAGILAQVQTHGNAARGEILFRRKDLACMNCHSIGGAGGQAGPDLLSLGASSPVDYILDSLLNPSAKIKEGYHTNTVALEDGKIVSGILVREGDSELVLRDAQNKEVRIPKENIDERITSPTSLMPGDLIGKLNRGELLDLVVYLASLGKEGPYKVPQNRYVRRWLSEDLATLFSRVDGMLPMEDIPGGNVFFDVEVTSPGNIGLKIRDPEGLKLTRPGLTGEWEGGLILMELPQGRQRLELIVPAGRTSPLQVEIVDVEGSAGRGEPANREP